MSKIRVLQRENLKELIEKQSHRRRHEMLTIRMLGWLNMDVFHLMALRTQSNYESYHSYIGTLVPNDEGQQRHKVDKEK